MKLLKTILASSLLLILCSQAHARTSPVRANGHYGHVPNILSFNGQGLGRKDPLGTKFMLMPFIDIGFTKYQYVINEAEYDYTDSKDNYGIPKLQVVKDEGYRVITSKDLSLGAGLDLGFWFQNVSKHIAWVGAGIGVMPYKNWGIRSEIWIDDQSEIKNAYINKIPKKATTLLDWWVGDKVSYYNYGGLLTYANINFYIALNLDAVFLAEGGWMYEVKRLADNRASLQITKGKLTQLKLASSIAFAAEVSIERIKEVEKTFKFVYDLDYDVARKAYEDALKGNLIPSQEMALDNHDERVSYDYEDKTVRKTLSKSFRLQVPLLSFLAKAEWSSGKSNTNSHTTYHESGDVVSSDFLTYFKRRHSNRLKIHGNKDIQENKLFTANTYKTTRDSEVIDQGQMAFFNWSYRNSRTKNREFKKILKKMSEYIGMPDKLKLTLPHYKTFGYVGAYLEVAFHQNALEKMADRISSNELSFVNKAYDKAVNYFDNGEDHFELCKNTPVDICRKYTLNSVRSSAKRLAGQVAMAVKFKSGKEFLNRMKTICKESVKKSFILQTLIATVPDETVIKYMVEGKLFPRYMMFFNGRGVEIDPDLVVYDPDLMDY